MEPQDTRLNDSQLLAFVERISFVFAEFFFCVYVCMAEQWMHYIADGRAQVWLYLYHNAKMLAYATSIYDKTKNLS